MDQARARQTIVDMRSRLDNATGLSEVSAVSSQVGLLANHLFGHDRDFTSYMESVGVTLEPDYIPRRRGSLLFSSPRDRFVAELESARASVRARLDCLLFYLDLTDGATLRPTVMAGGTPLVGRRGGAPQPATVAALIERLESLQSDVVRAALSLSERDELLATLDAALAILRSPSSPDHSVSQLQRLIGEAVVQATRSPSSRRLWQKVAEVVILTEAAFSLGSIAYGMIEAPEPVTVTVECVMTPPEMLALPPGDPAGSASVGSAALEGAANQPP